MAATVLGKLCPQPLFCVTGTLVAGALTITDPRITTAMSAIVQRWNNAGTLTNAGHLEITVSAGSAVVTGSNASEVLNILVIFFENVV